MKPRLLIILNRLVVGGQSIDTIPLAIALKEAYDILILFGEKQEDEQEFTDIPVEDKSMHFKKINTLKRSINPLMDLFAFFELRKTIRAFQPSIVHTHGSKPGVAGRLAAWSVNVPVIVHTFHGHLFHSYYNKIVSWFIIELEKLLARITAKLVVLSEAQQKELVEKYKIAALEKTTLIPLGIEEISYADDLPERIDFRKKYHLDQETVAIAIIGRMVPVKNHLFFIDVIEKLQPYNLQVKFFFIGDGILKNDLQEYLSDKGITWSESLKNLSAKVIFTSWVVPVSVALHAMDIVVLTSSNEGTPLSLIEAQLCHKPVVAINVGGVKDTFINNKSGFLIENHNAEKFAEKLFELIENKELRIAMGEKGYLFAKEKFSKQAEVNAFRKMYAQCLSSLKK